MANGNAYPAVMLDPDGNPDSAAVTLQFTDSTDQPGTGGGGGGGLTGWLSVEIDGLPALGLLKGTAPYAQSERIGAVSLQSPPLVVAAMGLVAQGFGAVIGDIPNISDLVDYLATVYVTDLTGTNTLTVSSGGSTATPIVGPGTPVDWTGTSATIVGADLSWDNTAAGVTSTAGGVYLVTLYLTAAPD